ncbi:sialidase family protein [Paenibacillus chungangensis]|uniref:Sialidase family protein n=1 Tax=Paenibacillus chungangensis TaxID=696535 RepID=A0ABW3HSZ9_9BACL
MEAIIEVTGSGLIYSNPKPHVYSRHAYFPSVIQLKGRELLASFSIGQAFESADLRTNIARSVDGGKSWTLEGPICSETIDEDASYVSRLSHGADGEVVAFTIRHNRSRRDEGLVNPANLGFVEVELQLWRSRDGGRTWDGPEVIDPPLVGPSFEMTSPILPLQSGGWLLPTSTWRGWDGSCPNGMKAVAFCSFDNGVTWPVYSDVMKDPLGDKIYWESKIEQMGDGRLVAAAWVYDEKHGCDLPIHYAVGHLSEEGPVFGAARSTGMQGQTVCLLAMDEEQLLIVYRRTDQPGLWAALIHLEGEAWEVQAEAPLWGRPGRLTGDSEDMAHNFAILKFGAPSICRLHDGELLVSFWASEDGLSSIRWVRLRIRG